MTLLTYFCSVILLLLVMLLVASANYCTSNLVVLGWVTICKHTMLVCNLSTRLTWPSALFGMENEYWQFSLAWKITIGVTLHWPCFTDSL